MRRRPLPLDLKGFVQRLPMRFEIRLDASIRIGAAYDGENGKKQDVRQLIELALRAARVGDRGEKREKRPKRLQGDLRSIRSPHRDSQTFSLGGNRPAHPTRQSLHACCRSATQWRALNGPGLEVRCALPLLVGKPARSEEPASLIVAVQPGTPAWRQNGISGSMSDP